MINHIQIPADYVEFAKLWYDGSGSMLYAIASTGNLTTGSHRPKDCDTDEQWYAQLYGDLFSELYRLEKTASPESMTIDEHETLEDFLNWVENTWDTLENLT